jgi:hypothetical protein
MELKVDQKAVEKNVEKAVERLNELLDRANKVADDLEVRERVGDLVGRAGKAARDMELKDRVSDAIAALRRTRVTTESESGVERFMTGLLIGVAVGFGIALLLAPKSGEEMREDLMQKGIELRDRAGQLTQKQFGDGEGSGAQKASASSESTGAS